MYIYRISLLLFWPGISCRASRTLVKLEKTLDSIEASKAHDDTFNDSIKQAKLFYKLLVSQMKLKEMKIVPQSVAGNKSLGF